MRKVTAGLFTSVDGVVQDPYEFQYDSFDDELGAGMGAFMARTDTRTPPGSRATSTASSASSRSATVPTSPCAGA